MFDGKKIAVLMGGTSGEREVSLRSGKMVYESLLRQGFDTILLDLKEDALDVLRSASFDIAFIMLHGRGGEDGTIQGVLEQLGIPYTGSGVTGSAVSMNKVMSKRLFIAGGIPTPEFLVLERTWDGDRALSEAEAVLAFPMVLKPVNEGSSLGVSILHDRDEFFREYSGNRGKYQGLFLERYIPGKCITVGVLGTGRVARPLPVLELIPAKEFYDYEAKYTKGMTRFVCPAELEMQTYNDAQRFAVSAHVVLGLAGFSRIDMQVSQDGVVYVLEANSIPGMTELSDLPAEARACGMSYDELVLEILKSALEEKH
ncbi:MAG: D-alanine--D-alanine ligase [Rhodocyclaceae bacterium]|nr:D-alanine--D-alanine ligase [Rhodocyclaceae bacterium]